MSHTTEKSATELILSFPRELKIQCLKDALEQDKFDIFLGLSRILLDTPINLGGLETEVIEEIHNEYLKKNGIKPI